VREIRRDREREAALAVRLVAAMMCRSGPRARSRRAEPGRPCTWCDRLHPAVS
jgi:hypothetical protein